MIKNQPDSPNQLDNPVKGQNSIPFKFDFKMRDSIEKIGPSHWKILEPLHFPFASYEYLVALEQSGSVGTRTGWLPQFLTAWEGDRLLGAIPAYLKTNSYGEYIFDFAWAQAYQANGLQYYPKLTLAIPFTPATGPKILLAPDAPKETANFLLEKACEFAKENRLSSIHALFITQAETEDFSRADYKVRLSYQFHWKNQNYRDFSDFLSRLKSKRRKEIIRERKQVELAGLKISVLTGDELNASHAQIMYQFYLDTTSKMGGHSYLTLSFFQKVFSSMKDQIAFVLALDKENQPVAGAINYFSEENLYGRYWGCLADYKSLHFEVCYYQLIEFAIQRNIKLFEAGAQGEHKFQRGFLPNLTYSAHRIFDQRFATAIGDFIDEERKQIDLIIQDYAAHNPFTSEDLHKKHPSKAADV